MEEIKKDPSRTVVFEKIEKYEKNGWFERDIEDDPPFKPINFDKVDYLKKKFSSKIHAAFATRAGKKFFENMLKQKVVIFNGVTGLENLKNFDEGAVITCNHIHHFDNYAVLLGFKQHFKKMKMFRVIKDSNFFLPGFFGFIMRNCNTLPINQNGKSPRTTINCINAIKVLLQNKKNKVLIYPEQSMWWNYHKPRPLKEGAFIVAAKAAAPIIPCFITLKDSDLIGTDGFPVQEFTLNVLPVISFNSNETIKENATRMMKENYEQWKETYEKTYGKKLIYSNEKEQK